MRRLLLTTAVVLALAGVGLAHGEGIISGNLRFDFTAHFAPKALPRDHEAPVSVQLKGSVATVNGSRPPVLKRIWIGINRYGSVFNRGLPICDSGTIESTSSEEALDRCRSALVGKGRFGAFVDFTKEEAFPVEGKILAFNGGSARHPKLLLHIYGSNPVKVTIVLAFNISHPATGTFGTVFNARIPPIARDLGYVTEMSLNLNRQYRYAGKPRSFFSARCAAPPGFTGGPFAFVRGKFTFSNSQKLALTLTRSCHVR